MGFGSQLMKKTEFRDSFPLLKELGHEKAFKYLDKNNYVFIGLNKNPDWFLNFINAPLMRCRHCH
jgi:hypothetical protein